MELTQTIERVKNLAGKVSNEEATKQHIILPILQALGWDIFDPDEVEPELSTGEGRPDYTLRLDGKPVVFLEAKSTKSLIFSGGKINMNHARQLTRYCFDRGVELGILTNGLQWALLKAFEPGKSVEERVILAVDLMSQETAEAVKRLRWLSKENILNYQNIPSEYARMPSLVLVRVASSSTPERAQSPPDYKFRTLYVSAREVPLPPSAVLVEELLGKDLKGCVPIRLFVNFGGKWHEITIAHGVNWPRVKIAWSSITAMAVRFLHDNGVRDFPEIGKYLSKTPHVDSKHWNVIAKVEGWYLYAPEGGRQAVEALHRIESHTGVKIAVDLKRKQ